MSWAVRSCNWNYKRWPKKRRRLKGKMKSLDETTSSYKKVTEILNLYNFKQIIVKYYFKFLDLLTIVSTLQKAHLMKQAMYSSSRSNDSSAEGSPPPKKFFCSSSPSSPVSSRIVSCFILFIEHVFLIIFNDILSCTECCWLFHGPSWTYVRRRFWSRKYDC